MSQYLPDKNISFIETVSLKIFFNTLDESDGACFRDVILEYAILYRNNKNRDSFFFFTTENREVIGKFKIETPTSIASKVPLASFNSLP